MRFGPAVTVPGLRMLCELRKLLGLVSGGRGCSSVVDGVTEPALRRGTSNGAISVANKPSSIACRARCCERSAKASLVCRDTWYPRRRSRRSAHGVDPVLRLHQRMMIASRSSRGVDSAVRGTPQSLAHDHGRTRHRFDAAPAAAKSIRRIGSPRPAAPTALRPEARPVHVIPGMLSASREQQRHPLYHWRLSSPA